MSKMTLGEALQLGLRKHQANQLGEAERIYQQILQRVPDNPDALLVQGVYLYFADILPRMVKFARVFLRVPGGHRERGLEYIDAAAKRHGYTAYDAKSGTVLWQGRLGEVVQSGFSASPVGVDGKIFFTNEGGETFVVKAGKTFELLHVNNVNEPVLASPAMVDGTWYFRTPFHLMAVGK